VWLIFLVTSEHRINFGILKLVYVVAIPSLRVYSFVTVYRMNFIIFFCVTLKLFSLNFVPLLAQILATSIVSALSVFRHF